MEHFYESIGENWFNYQDVYKKMVEMAKPNSHFVEVGSWKGRSSVFMAVEIINSIKKIQFDCVDTWEGSIEHTENNSVINRTLYDEFLLNIKPVSNVIRPIQKLSLDAAKDYADESLDFVFIDASHEYEDVLNDIRAWMPKIKSGGWIAGHDYVEGRKYWEGVYDAVNEYFKEIPFQTMSHCDAWLYQKP